MGNFQTQQHHLLKTIFITLSILITYLHNSDAEWVNHGGDMSNSRNAIGEAVISPVSVSRLKLKWSFYAGMDISATPAILGGVVYFPSWNGNLYAVNAFNGALIWKQNLTHLTGLTGTGLVANVNVTVSRSTPTIAGSLLIVGIYGPAVVIAVSRSNGRLVWMTQVDPRPRAVITMSGTYYNGEFYFGVSSLEVALPADKCCTFRGSMVKLNALTGAIKWQTYTLPDNGGTLGGYSGAALWGSSPAIDPARRLVYAGTGNLYSAPPQVLECQEEQNNLTTTPANPDQCISPDVNFNSILAFDMESGRIGWARQLGGYDVFFYACLVPGNPDCPPGPNVDADFGEAPLLVSVVVNGRRRDIVVAVQKSGFAWALDRDNGEIVWFKLAGPGGLEGGGIWGSATDGKRVYTNIANGNRLNFTLAPSTRTTTAGAWVALDARNGEIVWSTANPSNETSPGPVSLANGVLFAGSVASNGPIYAMDANSGRVLWTKNTGATIYGGASMSYGCVYIGNGFSVGLARFHPSWTSGTSLYAFCLA